MNLIFIGSKNKFKTALSVIALFIKCSDINNVV